MLWCVLVAALASLVSSVMPLHLTAPSLLIYMAQARPIHKIALHEGSTFVAHPPEAYNLFVTTAVSDGAMLWDLRTQRCCCFCLLTFTLLLSRCWLPPGTHPRPWAALALSLYLTRLHHHATPTSLVWFAASRVMPAALFLWALH